MIRDIVKNLIQEQFDIIAPAGDPAALTNTTLIVTKAGASSGDTYTYTASTSTYTYTDGVSRLYVKDANNFILIGIEDGGSYGTVEADAGDIAWQFKPTGESAAVFDDTIDFEAHDKTVTIVTTGFSSSTYNATYTISGFTYESNISDYEIINSVSLIEHTDEEIAQLNLSSLQAVQNQVTTRKIIGTLRTSASRYGKGQNVSFDWSISFDVNNALIAQAFDDMEEVREYLHDTENEPIEDAESGYTLCFATNMTGTTSVKTGQSLDIEYTQIMMSGSCTMVYDGLLGQSIKAYLKIGSGAYAEVVNRISLNPYSEIKLADFPVANQTLRSNKPLTADGVSGFMVQYKRTDSLHATLLGYCLDHTTLFPTPPTFGYKLTLDGVTLVEWTKVQMLKPEATIINGDYITMSIPLIRSYD